MSERFDRTLKALQLLQVTRGDPVSLAAWEEVRAGLLQMRREHEAAQAVIQAGRTLIAELSAYEAVLDTDSPDRIVQLADACAAAERVLAQALARMPAAAEPDVSPRPVSRH